MRALVTGGAGFIGSNLVDALVARGDSVSAIDDLSTGRRENLDRAIKDGALLTVADIRKRKAMVKLLDEHKPEVVFHLAAQIDVRKSVSDPALDARINVEGTINLLEAARQSSVGRFVCISTGGALYGEADRIPAPETAPIKPLAPYGQSKFAAEGYCDLYNRLHDLSTISLRLGNVYGPRQDPLGEAGVIAIFCGRLREGARPTVFGDGRQTRDYLYVSDVVSANLAAAESRAAGPFNIGCGRETSVLTLIEALRPHADRNGFKPRFAPERPGEVRRNALDATKAERELGWRAQVDLAEGIERTLASLG